MVRCVLTCGYSETPSRAASVGHRIEVGTNPCQVDHQRRCVDARGSVERRAGRRLDGVQIWSSSSGGGLMRPRLIFDISSQVWRLWEKITPIATRITKLMMPTVMALM